MVVIIPDDRIRNVKLTGDEIETMIDEFERLPHNMFLYFGYGKIINKLKEAKDEKEKNN